jgi:4-hydroxybenzoate polyprenyltransferase
VWKAVPPVAWLLLLATMLWAIAYDTEYAMVDRDDDLKIGVKSSAILFGRFDVLGVVLSHALFLGLMTGIGVWQLRGPFYFAGLTVASALVIYQYLLIRDRSREGCFRAFLNNNWVGCVIFAGMAVDWWRSPQMLL